MASPTVDGISPDQQLADDVGAAAPGRMLEMLERRLGLSRKLDDDGLWRDLHHTRAGGLEPMAEFQESRHPDTGRLASANLAGLPRLHQGLAAVDTNMAQTGHDVDVQPVVPRW